MHKLERGAVIHEVTGVHVSIKHFGEPSVSTQIAALRRLLLGPSKGAAERWFGRVKEVRPTSRFFPLSDLEHSQGHIPLVVETHNADIIATLIMLKKEVEQVTRQTMKMTITGAAEAYILAKELSESGVGVILNPARPFPYAWEGRRM